MPIPSLSVVLVEVSVARPINTNPKAGDIEKQFIIRRAKRISLIGSEKEKGV